MVRVTKLFVLLLALAAFADGARASEVFREGAPVYAYVFNTESKDVTIIDTASREVLATRPLGAAVRWLSNEQHFWDGRVIWTYDIVKGRVELLAIEPRAMRVVFRLDVGKGPAHSVQITPDHRRVLVNAAGDDALVVLDRASLAVERRIPTGDFPCDIDLAPGLGRAYFPERDQDTVAALDLARLEIVAREAFPKGSRPHMLRVAPDEATVWVQTAGGGTNDVLDAATLAERAEHRLGKVPVTNAWTPDGRESWVTHFGDRFIAVIDAKSLEERARIEVGQGLGNIAFTPDGRFAWVTVIGENVVAVIDTATREVVQRIPTGDKPFGLVLMSPPEGG